MIKLYDRILFADLILCEFFLEINCLQLINTDPSYKVGEHWLGFYFDNQRKCYFFDSFGHDPEYFGLENYVDKNSTEMESNQEQIQGFFSNTCGHYTILLYYFYYTIIQLSKPLLLGTIINNNNKTSKNNFFI